MPIHTTQKAQYCNRAYDKIIPEPPGEKKILVGTFVFSTPIISNVTPGANLRIVTRF